MRSDQLNLEVMRFRLEMSEMEMGDRVLGQSTPAEF